MNYSDKGYGKRPMWQWIVIYLLIGSLVYAAIYYAYSKNKSLYTPNPTAYPSPTPTATPKPTTSEKTPTAGQFTITYKSTGFDPQSLTIKAGDTVTWTNAGGGGLFVASDPHPSHLDYPALNLGIIKDGQSKSLTFPTAGNYKYHNHLDASKNGSITVQ